MSNEGCDLVPEADVLFQGFLHRAGTFASARAQFQLLITDLVGVWHPATNEVAGPGGRDWGIDTYVGRLDDSVVVWQSKFFLPWRGDVQQNQVRESFKELMKRADEEGFKVAAWTLCVPSILPPEEQKWFDGWSAREQRKHPGLRITIWNGIELRKRLMRPDAADVYRSHFDPGTPVQTELEVRYADDLSALGDAMFVRQLEAAGQVETDAARGFFFAAEALARDVAATGNQSSVGALRELHLELQALWEEHFNSHLPSADKDGKMVDLLREVLHEAAVFPDVDGLRLRPAHRKGIVHRLVEDVRAGWVTHWREIAESHKSRPAVETLAAQLAGDSAEGSS